MPIHTTPPPLAETLGPRPKTPTTRGDLDGLYHTLTGRLVADTYVPPAEVYYRQALPETETGRWMYAVNQWRAVVHDAVRRARRLDPEAGRSLGAYLKCTPVGRPAPPEVRPYACRRAAVCLFCFVRRSAEAFLDLAGAVRAAPVPLGPTVVRPDPDESPARLLRRNRSAGGVLCRVPTVGCRTPVAVLLVGSAAPASPEAVADAVVSAFRFPYVFARRHDLNAAVRSATRYRGFETLGLCRPSVRRRGPR